MKLGTVRNANHSYDLIERIPANQPGWPWRDIMTPNVKSYHIAVRDDGELVVVFRQAGIWGESCIVPFHTGKAIVL